jgi:hypothetical protein
MEAMPQSKREVLPHHARSRDPARFLVFYGTRVELRTLLDYLVDRGVHGFREFLADYPAVSRGLPWRRWRNAGCGWSMRMPVATERTSAERSSRAAGRLRGDCVYLASGSDAAHAARSFGKIRSVKFSDRTPIMS